MGPLIFNGQASGLLCIHPFICSCLVCWKYLLCTWGFPSGTVVRATCNAGSFSRKIPRRRKWPSYSWQSCLENSNGQRSLFLIPWRCKRARWLSAHTPYTHSVVAPIDTQQQIKQSLSRGGDICDTFLTTGLGFPFGLACFLVNVRTLASHLVELTRLKLCQSLFLPKALLI